MYNIFTDKTELFECKIQLEGASLKNAFARIIIESDEYNLLFLGEIDSVGNCKIPIKKLSHVLPEGLTGNMKLEVIADDTYFNPWSSQFTVKKSKTIQVEVKSQSTSKPIQETKKITVEVKSNISPEEHAKQLAELLKRKHITPKQMTTDKKVHKVLEAFMKDAKIINKMNFLRDIRKFMK